MLRLLFCVTLAAAAAGGGTSALPSTVTPPGRVGAPSPTVSTRDVWVAPGVDLVKVRDEIRALRADGEKGPITVTLATGRYALADALALDGRDGDVTWRAAPGAEVRVSGGRLVTTAPQPVTDPALLKRLPAEARGKVVQFDLASACVDMTDDLLYNPEDAVQRRVADTWNQGEFVMGSHPVPEGVKPGHLDVFVDDRPLTRARSRRDVFYHIDRLLGKTEPSRPGVVSPEARFTFAEEIPAGWSDEPTMHVCGCWSRDWADQYQRVVRLDRASRTMELSHPAHQYKYRSGTYFYGVNMLCELDEPGEWYLDRATGKLIVWMPDGAGRRVEISQAGRLVELSGATNVVFGGITFEACRTSAVRMKDCVDCRLEDCTVRNVGQHALIVEDGRRCGARRCRFHGLGGAGAFLVDGNRKTLEASGHFAEFCDIHDYALWNRMYRPGVCLAGVGMRAVGNRIHDAPHAAILFFGCELLMQSNEIFRVNRETKDCGAIYSGRSWLLRGNRILDNSFHDIIGLQGAYTRTIYLDDSMADTLIAGNRFERCTWAIFIGGSRDNVITNNVFVDCPNAFYVDARGRGWQRPHVEGRVREIASKGTLQGIPLKTGVYAERYPAVKDLPGSDPYSPVGNVVTDNVFDRGNGEWIAKYGRPAIQTSPEWWRDELSLDEVIALGTFRNNVVDGKPLNAGVWYLGPDGGAWSVAANWSGGRVPVAGENVVVPNGKTVVAGAADWASVRRVASVRLVGPTARFELRDAAAGFEKGDCALLGAGEVRIVSTGAKPARFDLRRENDAFAGAFFFTNVNVYAHGPKSLGRWCPVTFCKTTAGPDCQFNFVGGGVYASDLTFVPPVGMMWYAVGAEGKPGETIVNRGRIVIPFMYNKHCGRILSSIPFRQEGLLDLGSRIDLYSPVTLRCPVRFWGRGEMLFTDDRAGRITVGEGFSLGGGLDLADSVAQLLESDDALGPWKELCIVTAAPSFGESLRRLSPAWAARCTFDSSCGWYVIKRDSL